MVRLAAPESSKERWGNPPLQPFGPGEAAEKKTIHQGHKVFGEKN